MPYEHETDDDFADDAIPPQMRLDPAHPVGGGPAHAVEASSRPAMAGVSIRSAALNDESTPGDRLQLQADQLTSHLRLRLREVDRREAALNSTLAEQENEVRGARLWFRERQRELAERAADLDRREQELLGKLDQQERSEREFAEARRRAGLEQERQADAQIARERQLHIREQTLLDDEAENAAVGAALAKRAAEQQHIEAQSRAAASRFHQQVSNLLRLMQDFLRGSRGVASANSKASALAEPASADVLIEQFAAAINMLHARSITLTRPRRC